MNNLKRNSIILLFITAIVLYFALKDDFGNVIHLLSAINPLWILVAIFAEFVFIFLESLGFYQLILSYGENYSLLKSFKLLVITKFFNGITPFASGGQPMQVYLMKKDGIRATKSANIIMQNFIIYQLALVTCGLFAIIYNKIFQLFPAIPILRRLVALGFIINTLVMVFLFIISFSEKFNKFIVNLIISVLAKTKMLKSEDEYRKRWQERCDDFHQGALFIKNNKMLCFKCYIYNLLALISFYLIPIFVIISISKDVELSLINTFVASSYVMIIGSFVPIPGGSGGIEYGFSQFFGNFIVKNMLSATLLLWRFITYYIPMIIGAIMFNIRKEVKE